MTSPLGSTFGNAVHTGRPQSSPGGPQATNARAPGAGAAERSGAPREGAPRQPQIRPELDLSDSALTRRDIPRGSLINIVA